MIKTVQQNNRKQFFDIVADRGGIGVPPYNFNGKELDQETGYYYYGARYSDPSTAL